MIAIWLRRSTLPGRRRFERFPSRSWLRNDIGLTEHVGQLAMDRADEMRLTHGGWF